MSWASETAAQWHSFRETVLSSAIAGTVSAFASTPVDVIKTRFMAASRTGQSGGVLGAGREIVAKEGWGALAGSCEPAGADIGAPICYSDFERACGNNGPAPLVTASLVCPRAEQLPYIR